MRKIFVTTAFCLALAGSAAAQEFRAVYVPVFETNTQTEADAVIANIQASTINQVFVQVRSRGDAYYFPNRTDSTYPNPEPRAQLFSLSPSDFDILQYYIDAFEGTGVEVHAWLTTYNAWSQSTPPPSPNHVVNAHPDWVTESEAGVTYDSNDDTPLDPGIPAVQDYLYNIYMDIVRNYDVDGIHFDYIRLLNADSGFDSVAKATFAAETGFDLDTDGASGQLDEAFEQWRRDQIAQLVERVHEQTLLEKPWVEVSAFTVNFTDSIENLMQGYNYWVAEGIIDVLHPSAYGNTITDSVADWDFSIGKLAANGNENDRPVVAALGSFLFADTGNAGDPPGDHDSLVTTLRGNARVPDGFNFFQEDSLWDQPLTPPDLLAQELFGTGGPMETATTLPVIAHKIPLGEESTPPNPVTGLSVTSIGGVPQITFSRPAAAGDGDLPVRYRVYRDTTTPVARTYDNLVMEWWDLDSSEASFQTDDPGAAGLTTVYYSVVATDDWDNDAVATDGPVSALGTIVESWNGGTLNTTTFSQTGDWFSGGSSAKSTAPGLTGTRSEFSSNATLDATATFTFTAPATGTYDVYITTPGFSSIDAANSLYDITPAGGGTPLGNGTVALTAANTGNQWAVMTTNLSLTGGNDYDVTISENAPQGDRFYADAIRVVRSVTAPVPEMKPPVSPATGTGTEVIVDSSPTTLYYDDDGSSGQWGESFLGGYFNSNARFYNSSNFPMNTYGMWVVDLPRSGPWAIDGWVRDNTLFATGAQYRFVDSGGNVISTAVSQRSTTDNTTTGDWYIDVDGVTDGGAYDFDAGRVYVTIYGNTGGSQITVADALRFRYVGGASSVSDWTVLDP